MIAIATVHRVSAPSSGEREEVLQANGYLISVFMSRIWQVKKQRALDRRMEMA